MGAECIQRRQARFAQDVEGAGQQHRDGAGFGHGLHADLRGVFDVVGGQAVEPGHQPGATAVGELVGVQLHRQAERARGLEHAPGLPDAEADGFGERIHRVHQSFLVQLGQPLDDGVDVGIRALDELRRQRVRGQVGGAHLDPQLLAHPPRHPQHPPLAVEIQAVAGLDLQRGDAVGGQRARAGQRFGQQLVLAGRAHRLHRRHDAAAGAGDVLVAGALQALLELAGAVAGEHQVGVAVDQTRGDQAAAQVDDRAGQAVGVRGQAGARAGVHDQPVAPAQRPVLYQAVAAAGVEGGQGGAEDQSVPGGSLRFVHARIVRNVPGYAS